MKKVIMAGLSTALLALAFTATAPSAAVPASATDVSDFNTIDHVDISNYPVSDPITYDDGTPVNQVDPLAANGCTKTHRGYQVDAYNHWGNHIWSFGSYLQDCYKNGMVVHKNWGVCWGWVSDNILNRWEFKGCGIEDQSKQSLPRQYIWRQWRGHFKACIYIAGCQTKDPWVYIGGRGDGTFGVNGGAG